MYEYTYVTFLFYIIYSWRKININDAYIYTCVMLLKIAFGRHTWIVILLKKKRKGLKVVMRNMCNPFFYNIHVCVYSR